MTRALLAALLLLAAPAAAQTPPEIEAMTQESFAQCREVGGNPSLLPEYLHQAELNGDGVPDYVTDHMGLQCENAWSYFCGSAGCPVAVWLSGPEGHGIAWSSHAQAMRVEGASVVVSLHGAFCDPPRMGADGCEERLTFAGQTPPAAAAPEPQQQAAAPARWELRTPQGAPAVATVAGPGNVQSLSAFCLGGQPWLAVVFHELPAAHSVRLDFAFSGGDIGGPAARQEGTGEAFVIGLAGHGLAGLLAGRDSEAGVTVDGAPQGVLTLAGSSRALRGALGPCHRF